MDIICVCGSVRFKDEMLKFRDEKNARARARRAEKHQGQVRLGKVYVDRDMLMDIVSVGNHDNR